MKRILKFILFLAVLASPMTLSAEQKDTYVYCKKYSDYEYRITFFYCTQTFIEHKVGIYGPGDEAYPDESFCTATEWRKDAIKQFITEIRYDASTKPKRAYRRC